jgi:hypothetical protein
MCSGQFAAQHWDGAGSASSVLRGGAGGASGVLVIILT